LAEDNETNQMVAQGLLKASGYQVDTVISGREALQALEKTDYDLVLMDVQMPEMDGLEASRCIRDPASRVQNRNVPIFAMTAHAIKGYREKCLEAGMNNYVTKPVDSQQLIMAIDQKLLKTAAVNKKGPETPADNQALFDLPDLIKRLRGEEELINCIFKSFQERTPALIAELQAAVSRQDAKEVKRMAHTIKGSSATVSAPALATLAQTIEITAEKNQLEQCPALINELIETFRKTIAALPEEYSEQTPE
ncbi:MAG: response regulator, partial [Deltaproteobacteria bacterium]|nr:response regulator [Deltaproteobacteria bacterium]